MERTARTATGPTADMKTATARTARMAMEPTAETATGPTARTATEQTGRTERPGFPHLGYLVGADATSAFLSDHFGRDAFRQRLAAGEASRLFNWEVLNRVLAEHRLGPPRLKLEKDGAQVGGGVFRERRPRPNQVLHDIDVPALYEHLRDGATLILDAVNELHAPLQRLCSGLAEEFSASSQTNHWDDHDVFVVLVVGRKRWNLYGFTQPAPLRRDRRNPAPKPTSEAREIVLEAGDMLYLPRGYWHAAIGLGEPSLHLTLGLSRKTGADFLHWLADEAVAELAVRTDLCLEKTDAELGDQVARLLQALAAQGDAADLGRRYRRHVEATKTHRPQVSFPHIGLPGEDLAPSSRLRLTDGASDLRTDGHGNAVLLLHRGARYTLAAETRPALERLIGGSVMTFGEIIERCRPASERLAGDFVAEMLRRGVLALAPDG